MKATIAAYSSTKSDSTCEHIRRELHAISDASRSQTLQRFFKTGPGEYAEGDIFIGSTMPQVRRLARQFREVELSEAQELLRSPIHEERMLALLILVLRFQKDSSSRNNIYRIYTRNFKWINNWDLIDVTAEHIVGAYLYERDRTPLYRWAKSKSIWPRRIAIMSTFHFIKRCDYRDTLRLAEMLLGDQHDLIHKATGWMLREVGNRDRAAEQQFLDRYAAHMPRTMLRYAIEKFPDAARRHYLTVRRD